MSPEDYKKMRVYMRGIRKRCIVIMLLIIISISISPVIGSDNQSTNNQSISNKYINNQKPINYRIAIDQYRGFYRVYIANTSGIVVPISYNGTLNIIKGDTITWMNDAVPDARLTVISQQKLWSDNSGVLKWAYKQFSYTFNKSGIYDLYIKEHSKFKQKVIVGLLESNSTNTIKTNISGPNKNVSKLDYTTNKMTNTTNKMTNTTNKMTNTTNKMTNTTNKMTNTTNKMTNTTNKMTNTTNKMTNTTNKMTNVSKNDEINIGKYNMFVILPMIAIISIIYIRKFQKKAR